MGHRSQSCCFIKWGCKDIEAEGPQFELVTDWTPDYCLLILEQIVNFELELGIVAASRDPHVFK